MHTRATIIFALVLMGTTALCAAEAEPGGNVAVTRVTLATGGLAEVEGRLDAPGDTMRLAIERALVADVLKTLVVSGDAAVRGIDLDAAEPVGERSATGRLLARDLADPTALLESLVGEEVHVRGGANEIHGRLLAYSLVTIAGSDTTGERPAVRIAVATEAGRVAYATFMTDSALAIEGAAVGARMAGVVPALRDSVDDGRRDLVVTLDDVADAGFSFVVPTTVWRPSYRAIIGADGAVDLQGWATLENTTGLDWDDIELRLAVGTPVAYRQDIYSPLRASRPTAPFEVGRTVEVPLVEQEMAKEAMAPGFRSRSQHLGMMADAAPAPVPGAAELVTGGPALAGSASTIFPVAGTVDLAAGRTLTVPFLSGSADAARIAFLTLDRGGALDALELDFDADATVPGGLVAVYDTNGYVGDARFGGADGGETTILPFAVSSTVDVRVTQENRRSLASASITDGALRILREVRRDITLTVDAATPTTLVVDIPRVGNENLAATAEGRAEVTTLSRDLARLRTELSAGTTTIALTGRRPVMEDYVVGNIPPVVIEEVLSVGGAVDEETATRLRAVAAAAAEIAAIDRELATLEADLADLREAVASDRDTLEAIDVSTPDGARVRQRLIARTDEIDKGIATLRTLRQARLEAERKLRNP
ncbi:MAG: hypothetical protein AcusKO_41150 [Acuticoccus sp.]